MYGIIENNTFFKPLHSFKKEILCYQKDSFIFFFKQLHKKKKKYLV